ncbi:MAG: hypothetical protein HYS98_01630 [Deltaproteobacteria bacterium]|nr:hypothetical protein [Deltaproteobacteria bacterium]
MNICSLLRSVLLLSIFTFLTCSTSLTTVTGVVFKGPVSNGQLVVKKIDSDGIIGEVVSTFQTNEEGQFTMTAIHSSIPYFIEAVSGTFKDEATGNIVTLTKENPITAFINLYPSGGESLDNTSTQPSFYITPLTTLSSSLALELVSQGQTIGEANEQAHNQLSKMFGISDFLIRKPLDLTLETASSSNDESALYGLLIAGLSQQASTLFVKTKDNDKAPFSIMNLLSALSVDIQDGIFDGKDKNNQTIFLEGTTITLPEDTITTKLSSSMKDFLKNEQNKSGLSDQDEVVKTFVEKIEKNTKSPFNIEITPQNNSIVVGSRLSLTFKASISGIENQTVTWSIEGQEDTTQSLGTISQDGIYMPPDTVPSNGNTVRIKAVSHAFNKLVGTTNIKLKKALALSPSTENIQIETEKKFQASSELENPSVRWFVNDIEGGNATIGTIIEAPGLAAVYKAPATLPSNPLVSVKVTHASHSDTSQIQLFETKVSVNYEGFFYDKVSESENLKPGDGWDALFKVSFDHGGDFSDKLVSISIQKKSFSLWDTLPQNGVLGLGLSNAPDSKLINAEDGSVLEDIFNHQSFYLQADDFENIIEYGGKLVFKFTLESGRILQKQLIMKKSLLIEKDVTLFESEPAFDFIGIYPKAQLWAGPNKKPLELLSNGHILIRGTLSASGTHGKDGGKEPGNGGTGAAGASEGGGGGKGIGQKGQGLGGGKNFYRGHSPTGGGGGGFGTSGKNNKNGFGGGASYGSAELIPLVGGSAGAGGRNYKNGTKGGGGGGAGGSLRLFAKKDIVIEGSVLAHGGNGGDGTISKDEKYRASGGGGASGGGILIQSEGGVIHVTPSGTIQALGGKAGNFGGDGGDGRIRTEGLFKNEGIISPSSSQE